MYTMTGLTSNTQYTVTICRQIVTDDTCGNCDLCATTLQGTCVCVCIVESLNVAHVYPPHRPSRSSRGRGYTGERTRVYPGAVAGTDGWGGHVARPLPRQRHWRGRPKQVTLKRL